MTLSCQISIIDELVLANPEATIGDYLKVLARMEPRQKKVSGPMKRMLWPHLYTPARINWPRARLFDPKLFTLSEKEKNYWKGKDETFAKMIRRINLQTKRA